MNITLLNVNAFLLIFVRICGMVLFNPLLSRRNIPRQVQLSFILVMTILLSGVVNARYVMQSPDLDFVLAIVRELFIGFACGMVFQIFYYFLFFIGDLMDVHFGLSMAKVFDPGTNIQMSVSGNLLSFIFILYIFATDSHLLLIKIFADSFKMIPLGTARISIDTVKFIIDVFINSFSLAIRLLLPFAVTEFVTQVSMGILMKLVPQIHVFVINIQIKLLMGIILLFLFAQPIASFTDNYIRIMFEQISRLFSVA